MIDLSLVSMDDMVEEIKKRFDTIVILTRRQVDENTDDIHSHFKDKIGCIGLMRIGDENLRISYQEKDIGTFNE